jgi:peroxiredoxin Q/BCP
VLGVSLDKPAANQKFATKYSFGYDLLSDETKKMALAYGAIEDLDASSAKRISYLIGPDGRIRKAYATVKAGDHPQQVLGDL